MPTPGILQGFWAVCSSISWLMQRPHAWPYALVPAILLTGLSGLAIYAAFASVAPEIAHALPAAESWYERLAVSLVAYTGALLGALIATLVAFIVTPPLSAPALERLVAKVEAELGVPPRPALGWLRETACGLRATLAAVLLTSPLMIGLSLGEWLIPPAIVVTFPAKFFVAALLAAYSMLDYPLTLRGMPIRNRLRLMTAAFRPLLGFGIGCSLLFWIPCCGVFLLPVSVVAGTRLLWTYLGTQPELGRELLGVAGPARSPSEA